MPTYFIPARTHNIQSVRRACRRAGTAGVLLERREYNIVDDGIELVGEPGEYIQLNWSGSHGRGLTYGTHTRPGRDAPPIDIPGRYRVYRLSENGGAEHVEDVPLETTAPEPA